MQKNRTETKRKKLKAKRHINIFNVLPPSTLALAGKILPSGAKRPLRKFVYPYYHYPLGLIVARSIRTRLIIFAKKTFDHLPGMMRQPVIKAYTFIRFVRLKKTPEIPVSEQPFGGEKIGLVSIVLPVFNHKKFLEASIKSVLAQTYQDFELIIIDDGSEENIEPILTKYFGHPKIRIYRQKNQGLPATLTSGFEMARGEFWTWTSADNIMGENQLKEQVGFLKKHPKTTMVYCNYRAIDDEGKPLNDPTFRPHNQSAKEPDLIELPRRTANLNLVQDNFIGACFMYRGWVGKAIGGYFAKMGVEDYDYWMRINSLLKIEHIGKKEPMYFYRVHEETLNSRAKALKIFEKVSDLMRQDTKRRNFYQKDFKIFEASAPENLPRPAALKSGKKILMVKNPFNFKAAKLSGYLKKIKINPELFLIFFFSQRITEWSKGNPVINFADWVLTSQHQNLGLIKELTPNAFYLKERSGVAKMVKALANNWLYLKKNKLIEKSLPPDFYFPRKVNLLIETKNLDKGGLERVICDIAEEIDKKKFNVCIVCTNRGGLLAEELKTKKIPVFVLGRKKTTEYSQIIQDKKIDLINTHYSNFKKRGGEAQKIPIVEFIHNTYCWLSQYEIDEFQKKDEEVKKYIAVSRNAAYYSEEILGINPSKIEVIPNGLNLKRFSISGQKQDLRLKLGFKKDDFIFFNPAAFAPPKGHFLILAALKKLAGQYPQIKVVSAGSPADPHFLKALRSNVSKEKLGERFLVLNYVKNVSEYYQAADAFLLPSFYEGWSIAVMEAMYHQLPMILTDVGGAKEVICNNDIGLVLPHPCGDVINLDLTKLLELPYKNNLEAIDHLSRAMINFYENRTKWKRAGRLGREKILNNFRLDKIVRKYEQIFIENIKS